MALQTVTNINIDFYDKKYILINAKQYDKNSRFLSVTCYNRGEIYPINLNEHSAYVRYKKPDNYSVFNFCEITSEGNILVELTEQMLAVDGISYVDLVIVNNGEADINENGEIISIDSATVLSTMTFCIDVSKSAVTNSEIESSYEYNGLNDVLEKANAGYINVVNMAKSYSSGGTGLRENEDIDNAKYYCELAAKTVVGDISGSLVVGVMGSKENFFRKGEVIISAENVGAVPIENIATVNEIKTYLGIE